MTKGNRKDWLLWSKNSHEWMQKWMAQENSESKCDLFSTLSLRCISPPLKQDNHEKGGGETVQEPEDMERACDMP